MVYPIAERPRLLVGQGDLEVLDCSELGLRYEAADPHHPEVGATVEGRVIFNRGVEIPVAGEVVRIQGGTIALWFRALALSYTVIVAEQEYLRSKGYAISELT